MTLLRALALLVVLAVPAQAAEVTLRVTVPAQTPEGDAIHVAGDFQGWNPGDEAYRLTPIGNHIHEITFSLDPRPIEFKFARGDWNRVEKGPQGEEIANRAITVETDGTWEFTVANWADLTTEARTLTGDVQEITVPGFLDGRRVWVYLPPDYADTAARYPVLYMLDGQNVFDASTSFAGEWEVDETCEELIPAGEVEPLIVVAVDNGGAQRMHEYTPWYDAGRNGGGGGGEHAAAIVEELVPWIDANYRTRSGPEHRGFAGSSLGGLMAGWTMYAYPEVFGRIGSVSPSIWWNDRALLDWVEQHDKPGSRVWIDMGTLESGQTVDLDNNGVDDSVDNLRALRDRMVTQGFVEGADLFVFEDEGARHNEAYWAERFPDILRFLFPRPSVPTRGGSFGGEKRRF